MWVWRARPPPPGHSEHALSVDQLHDVLWVDGGSELTTHIQPPVRHSVEHRFLHYDVHFGVLEGVDKLGVRDSDVDVKHQVLLMSSSR